MQKMSWRRIGLYTAASAAVLLTTSGAFAQVVEVTPPPRTYTPGLNDDGPAGSDALGTPAAPVMIPPAPWEPPSVFPLTPYADHPHPGDPASPSVGQPHYDSPFWRFGHWFRPKAATLTAYQRCKCPDPFRPRGFGNLFAKQCSPYRMEYDPYVITDERNQYGPSYFMRQPDQFCRDHHPRRR